jgi:hypothetical protein
MNPRHTTYAQIAQVLLRYMNPQDARWLYFVIACCAVLTAAGGGIATQWGVAALIRSVIGLVIFCLQFFGVYAFTALMRLNHPVASRLVPGYVPALRRTALAIWLGVCLVTGLAGMLEGVSLGAFFLYVFMAGATMLLISAPLRWPVQWVLFLVGLVWFLRHSVELFASGPLHVLVMNKMAALAVAMLVFGAMGWLVTRLIAEKGSSYASMFSRFLGMQQSERVVDKPDALLPNNKFGIWYKAYTRAAHWARLPWQSYASYVLANPKPGATNTVARAELGFGALVHWVTQGSFSVGFMALLAVGWWIHPALLVEHGASTLPITAFHVGLVSVLCAATSVLYIGDVMLRTCGEQKLMLLLPGMPQGNALSRILAARHLRQALAAWPLATVWALVLPYPDSVADYVAAFCWGTLPLVPFVVQDWASMRPPQAGRALLTLVLTMLVPLSALAALRWLHIPIGLLAGIAVVAFLLVLQIRWSRLARFSQAFPVGRRAENF